MKVVFGFGNPEEKYRGTRHNIGFWATDSLAESWGVQFKLENKFSARVASTTVASEKVLLVQPQTYYNEIGTSARAILDFYKLEPSDFLLIHDDLALPLGTIRTRSGGSDGGNNGLKSIASHLGLATNRVRVGVWVDGHQTTDNISIVLGKLTRAEQQVLSSELPTIEQVVASFISGTFEATTHTVEK